MLDPNAQYRAAFAPQPKQQAMMLPGLPGADAGQQQAFQRQDAQINAQRAQMQQQQAQAQQQAAAYRQGQGAPWQHVAQQAFQRPAMGQQMGARQPAGMGAMGGAFARMRPGMGGRF